MGRIKTLRELVAKGEATDDQKVELEELQAEAAEVTTPEVDTTEEDVNKFADALVAKIGAKFDKMTAEIEAKKPAEKTVDSNFIVDKKLGKVSFDELSEMKIVLPGRKEAGKTITDVTGKTVAFVQSLMQGDKQKLQLLTEGSAVGGGYLVPEEFANMIVEDKRDAVIMRQLAQSMTTSTDTLHLPALDTRPKANWRGEAAVKATSTAQFTELVFTPYSLAVIVGLSQELADDAQLGVGGSIVNYVARLMVQALAEAEDKAFWTGNGSSKPTGIANYSLVTITTGSTDANVADGIKKSLFRLPQGYRNGASYVANAATLERISILKDTNGNYLLTRLADDPTQLRLNGRPVYEQNDIANNTIYFGDFGYYMIVDRQGVTVDFSTEATVGGSSAFEKNLVFVRVEQRVDAELTLTAAVRKITIS